MAHEQLSCFLVAPFGDKEIQGEGKIGTSNCYDQPLRRLSKTTPIYRSNLNEPMRS
jgi:hypothetical protein